MGFKDRQSLEKHLFGFTLEFYESRLSRYSGGSLSRFLHYADIHGRNSVDNTGDELKTTSCQ